MTRKIIFVVIALAVLMVALVLIPEMHVSRDAMSPPDKVDASETEEPEPVPPPDTATPEPPPIPLQPASPDESTLEDELAKLSWGNIVYNAPDSMMLGQTHPIQLLLSPVMAPQQLESRIVETGQRFHRRLKIARVMVAELKGSGFHVEPITKSLQYVDMHGDTEWRWEVTAIKDGPQRLYLTLEAILNVDGQDRPHTIKSAFEEIDIYVTWRQQVSTFVSQNWQWLWTTVLVPFAGWLWERRRSRKAGKRK